MAKGTGSEGSIALRAGMRILPCGKFAISPTNAKNVKIQDILAHI